LQVIVSGRHVGLNTGLKGYAREKAEKMAKYFHGIHRVTVTLAREGDRCAVEMIVAGVRGQQFVARESAADMYSAVDAVHDKMERQLTRFKEKLTDKRRGEAPEAEEVAEGMPPDQK
jgi:putative sigma-54 modulation protein